MAVTRPDISSVSSEANWAVLLDPMHRTNWCAFRMVRQDRLRVQRDGVACDECRIGEVAVNTLRNIAMAVEATLLFWRDRDLESREGVAGFGSVGNVRHQAAFGGSTAIIACVSANERTSASSNSPRDCISRWHSGKL